MNKLSKARFPLLHWSALSALLLLVLNDHYLKQAYHNWWTGKLSDLLGLYLLGLVLSQVFPRLGAGSFGLSGLLFILWKLPVSTPLVVLLDSVLPWGITRVVDYSDLFTLLVLPPAYLFWRSSPEGSQRNEEQWRPSDESKQRARFNLSYLVLLLSLVAFSATSPPLSYRMMDHNSQGDIQIEEGYQLKGDTSSILAYFVEQGIQLEKDTGTIAGFYLMQRYSTMDSVFILSHDSRNAWLAPDTINRFTFTIAPLGDQSTQLVINHLDLINKEHFADWRVLKQRKNNAVKGFENLFIVPLKAWLKRKKKNQ